mmetsp:Transcript_9314/g.10865  ORF Transcript_9314/g.10865 Transcript_9314/m.10865 type:complete len:105 (-) Transcript_9314:54-368(-)
MVIRGTRPEDWVLLSKAHAVLKPAKPPPTMATLCMVGRGGLVANRRLALFGWEGFGECPFVETGFRVGVRRDGIERCSAVGWLDCMKPKRNMLAMFDGRLAVVV